VIQTGAVHLEAGQLAEAERYGSTALDLTRRHGGRGDEAWTLHLLAEVAARRDRREVEQALDRLVGAQALAGELGMAPLQARCHLSLGRLRLQVGQAEDARAGLSRAVELLGRMQMWRWLSVAETLLANA
jgi:tetratricopeptide (TPR) repeat protein